MNYFQNRTALSTATTVLLIATLNTSCSQRAAARAKAPTPISTSDYTPEKYAKDRAEYEVAATPGDQVTRRTRIVLGCMRAIDLRHYWMEQDLVNARAAGGLAFDMAKLGGAALGTVSGGARGKSIISAVLAGVVGTQISIDKNWFANQGVNALISAMRTGRSRVKDKLLASLSKTDNEYPLDLAESAVLDYYMAGTLTGGLQELHEQASLESKTTQVLQKDAIGMANPVTGEDLTFATELRKWLSGQKASPDSAKIDGVFSALKAAQLSTANAETPLAKLEAIEILFRKSVVKGSGLTPEALRAAIATKIQ